MKKALLLFALLETVGTAPAAIVLCPNTTTTIIDARHGIAPARFGVALDPGVPFDKGIATVVLVGGKVLIDQPMLPGSTVPCSSGSALVAELTQPLEPGTYALEWTVRRMVACPSGQCVAELATLTRTFTVPEPLGCISTGDPFFDTLPYPPIAGSPVKLLFSKLIYPMPTDPLVTATGNAILVTQTAINTGPPPPPGPLPCNSQVIDLGNLPAGRYTVVWQIDTGFGNLRYSYSFDVLPATALPTLHWTIAALLGLSFAVTGALVLRR